MKRLLLFMAIFMATATGMSLRAEKMPANPDQPQDTIFIKLSNGAGLNLIVKNTEQLKTLKQYKLDSLMAMLSIYVEQAEKIKSTGSDTKDLTVTFHPSKDLNDPNAPQEIQITVSARNTKNSSDKRDINNLEDALKVYIEYKEKKRNNPDSDSIKIEIKKAKAARRTTSETYVDLGLNTFLNVPDENSNLYDLKPLGSRFVNIAHYYIVRIGRQNSPFYLKPGLELTFNNYMFDNNNYLVNDNGISRIQKEANLSFEKSKLATSSINASLMPELRFGDKKSKKSFRIGAGGFAGYRIGSHTKIKYQSEGRSEKDKERGSFNLEDFQYGVNFSIGYRKLELYTKYNLNELFKDNRGPSLNVISFGFRI